MNAFFVTGAGTEIGKTYVCAALLRAWRAQGVACTALKPVVSGFDEADFAASDPALLLAALGVSPTLDRIAGISPWRYRAPLAPPLAAKREGKSIDLEAVAQFCVDRRRVSGGVLLIEGAGGVMAPLADAKTNIDLIAALRLPAVFVAGSYLGAVSHALTALEALERRDLAVAAIVVSESEASAGLEDACAMLDTHGVGAPITPARRGDQGWAAGLAAALAERRD